MGSGEALKRRNERALAVGKYGSMPSDIEEPTAICKGCGGRIPAKDYQASGKKAGLCDRCYYGDRDDE